MTENAKPRGWLAMARDVYLAGGRPELLAEITSHIPTAEDVAEMSEGDRHTLRGPEADLDKREGAAADGWHTFEAISRNLAGCGYEFFGPGEHPLPTRFAVRRAGEPFTGRSSTRDLSMANDLVESYRTLNSGRYKTSTF